MNPDETVEQAVLRLVKENKELKKRIEFLELSLVQLWHTGPEAAPLQELLGFTPEQYRDWLRGRANLQASTELQTPGSDSAPQSLPASSAPGDDESV